jgi:hypothetical protein
MLQVLQTPVVGLMLQGDVPLKAYVSICFKCFKSMLQVLQVHDAGVVLTTISRVMWDCLSSTSLMLQQRYYTCFYSKALS